MFSIIPYYVATNTPERENYKDLNLTSLPACRDTLRRDTLRAETNEGYFDFEQPDIPI